MLRGRNGPWREAGFIAGAAGLALVLTILVLLPAGVSPWAVFYQILAGASGSLAGVADVLVAWVPLILAAAGLLVAFSAGLWNIGVEGQIMAGAIVTTAVIRGLQGQGWPPLAVLVLALIAGTAGGALWGLLAGVLKTAGGVNEIFGGLGLNFVATAVTIWLIFGPWKRPGIGSMSGTEPFADCYSLGQLPGLRLCPAALVLALAVLAAVWAMLRGTYFGLRLKAVGANPRAAHLLGIPPGRYLLGAFAVSGATAGLAGALQVTAIYHRLIPAISSGYGFLGLMVALLAGGRVAAAAGAALFFAMINIGSIQLPISLGVDSNLSGVLQGFLVLSVLFMEGLRRTVRAGCRPAPDSSPGDQP